MIDINLIPSSLRKKSVSGVLFVLDLGLSREILLGVIVFCAGLLISTHACLLAARAMNGVILAGHRSQWEKILPQKKDIEALGDKVKDLRKKMDKLTDIVSPRTIAWPRKLNGISDALPKGLWLRIMTLDNAVLTMEGSVIARDQNEIVTVGTFVSNLKKDKFFMRSFAGVEVVSIRHGKKGVMDVADFTLTARLK